MGLVLSKRGPRRRARATQLLTWPLAALAALLLVAGCATPPPPGTGPQPMPVVVDEPGPVVARSDEYVIVSVQASDTLDTLAKRYLGDAGKAWWIAQFNNVTSVRAGQILVVPLRQRNPLGVVATGYQAIPILCYHRFGPRATKLNVTPQAFEQQMEFLARNGYTVISLERLQRFLAGKEAVPAKSVVVTIDDGYRSTYEIAWPVLKKFGFPATVFLYTDFVGASDAMTWAQMKTMTDSKLITLQPHSKSHANLTLRLPGETDARYRERIRREVLTPVGVIKDRLGEATRDLCLSVWRRERIRRRSPGEGRDRARRHRHARRQSVLRVPLHAPAQHDLRQRGSGRIQGQARDLRSHGAAVKRFSPRAVTALPLRRLPAPAWLLAVAAALAAGGCAQAPVAPAPAPAPVAPAPTVSRTVTEAVTQHRRLADAARQIGRSRHRRGPARDTQHPGAHRCGHRP